MLDEKRIRQMTKLAFFEKKEEKNALRIGRYFRSDYIGKELLKNFFLASIGYILVLAVAVLYHIEWLVDEIDTIDLQFAAGCLIASYLCFLAVYSIAVYVISTIRYQGAQKKLKWYGKELDDDEANAYILKDISTDTDAEAEYVMVEDDTEFDAVSGVFASMLDDEADITY